MMKKIIILLALIAGLELLTGAQTNATEPGIANQLKNVNSSDPEPAFTSVSGNLFLAIELNGQFTPEDGDMVQFDFGGTNKLISFHVNDRNKSLNGSDKSELFVFIHHDLALMLREQKLKRFTISHNKEQFVIDVNSHWIPDQLLKTS